MRGDDFPCIVPQGRTVRRRLKSEGLHLQIPVIRLVHTYYHGRRNRGAQGAHAPHFSKTRAMCPFSCNLVALFESFKNAEMNRKIRVSGDFRRSKFQNFPGACPGTPLAGLHCFTPQIKCSISLPDTLPRCPSMHAPTSQFCNACYTPAYYHEIFIKNQLASL